MIRTKILFFREPRAFSLLYNPNSWGALTQCLVRERVRSSHMMQNNIVHILAITFGVVEKQQLPRYSIEQGNRHYSMNVMNT